MKKQGNAQSLKFEEGNQPSVSTFFDEYRQAFPMSDDIQMEEYKVTSDKIGTHHRYNQYYKGIEILGAQYVLHEKNDAVWYANGQLVHRLDMDVNPDISEETALAAALSHINANAYMWENPKNEAFLKKEQNDPNASFYPKGELKLTSGRGDLSGKTMRLVYRFDIYAQQPLSRNWVDVDAKTGEIINVTNRIHNIDLTDKTAAPATGNEIDNNTKTRATTAGRDCIYCDAFTGNASEEWISNLTFNTINNSQNSIQPYEDFTYLSTDVYIGETYTASVSCGSVFNYEEQIWLYFDWNADCDFDDPGESYYLGQTLGPGTLSMAITIPDITSGSIRMRVILSYYNNPESACDITMSYGQVEDYSVNMVIFTAGDIPGSGISYYNGNVDMIADEYSPNNFRLRENTTRAAPIHTFSLQNSDYYNDAVDIVSPDLYGFWDAVGLSAHWGTEATYDYYFESFGRNSIDDMGFPLQNYVHLSVNFNNAFWDGSRMTYGDGDGINYNPLVSIDIIGHELTHGVTEFTANLRYYGESGALNESFSDIFGNLVEFQEEGPPGIGTGSWRMGEDMTLFGQGGLRNMADPKEFYNPDTYYGDFWRSVNSTTDNGGVHFNSGIQNFWFYLLSTGGDGTNDKGFEYNVTGIGLENAAAIAYYNLTSILTPSSNFYAARDGSIVAAEALFGVGSQQALSTADAWDAVGVYQLPVPENDDCANAIALSCGETITGNTVYATFDTDAPFCDTEHTTNGVWYTVAGDGSIITASMCRGRVYDARMTVYGGTCGALVCVGADDDGCGGYENVSKYSWQSVEGTTYFILIHGFQNATGEFTLSIEGSNPDAISINPSALTFDLATGESTSAVMTIANEGPVCTKDLNWVMYKNGVLNANATPENPEIDITKNPVSSFELSPRLPNSQALESINFHDHEMMLISADGENMAPSGPPLLVSGSGKINSDGNSGPLASVVEPITLTHSLSQNLNGISVACLYTGLGYTSATSGIRDFNLADFGITSDFNVTEVEVGVRKASSGSGSQPVNVYLYTWNPENTVTLIDSANFQIPDQQFTMLTLPVSTLVPANSRLLVQIATPDGLADGNTFYIAANDGGQSALSYMYAPTCSNDNYFWPLEHFGFPNVHYVMNVKGYAEVSSPWLSFSGWAGNTGAGSTDEITLNVDATGLAEGSYSCQLRVNNNGGSGTNFVPVTMNVIHPLQIDLTVMLEGPFNYTDKIMESGLNAALPLEQPYNIAPWNYSGDEALIAPSTDYIDWVLIELRDAPSAAEATADKMLARQAALVKSDGQVVDVFGNPILQINNAIVDNMYIVVHHRNHISVVSANALTETGGTYSYDFSSAMDRAYGGSSAHKLVSTGVWAMFAADGNGDGVVNTIDKSTMWENEAGSKGYLKSDFNLDGESNNFDKNEKWLPNLGKTSQVPD